MTQLQPLRSHSRGVWAGASKTKTNNTRSWASEGFFPGRGTSGDFSKVFLGGSKVVKLGFSHSKLRNQPVFAEKFKIQGSKAPPWPPPSDARARDHLPRAVGWIAAFQDDLGPATNAGHAPEKAVRVDQFELVRSVVPFVNHRPKVAGTAPIQRRKRDLCESQQRIARNLRWKSRSASHLTRLERNECFRVRKKLGGKLFLVHDLLNVWGPRKPLQWLLRQFWP